MKSFLDSKYDQYNRPDFIESDPIQIPHLFTLREDIEIAGFLTTTLSWGQRTTIINKARELMRLMDDHPFAFITGAAERDLIRFEKFCHRTFNATDTLYFLAALKNIYARHGGLYRVFEEGFGIDNDARTAIAHFRRTFFETDHPARTCKHIANVEQGASAKRLNLFLRWMVRIRMKESDSSIWFQILHRRTLSLSKSGRTSCLATAI